MDAPTSNELVSALERVVHLKAIYCASGVVFGVMGLILFLARINRRGAGFADTRAKAALSMERGGPGLILAVLGGVIVMIAEFSTVPIAVHQQSSFQGAASKNPAREISPTAGNGAEGSERFVTRFPDTRDAQSEHSAVREKLVEVDPAKTEKKAEQNRQGVETKGNNTLRLMPSSPTGTKREPGFLTLERPNNVQQVSNDAFNLEEGQKPQATNSAPPVKLTRPFGLRIRP